MELIADGVLILAAIAATAYCMVLSRRLRRLSEMDGGLGAAIMNLSREVDHLNAALAEAKTATTDSATDLGAQCRAANAAARRLEALVNRANKAAAARTHRSKGVETHSADQDAQSDDPAIVEKPAPAIKTKPPATDEDTRAPVKEKAKEASRKTTAKAAPALSESAPSESAPSESAPSESAPSERAAATAASPPEEAIDAQTLDRFIGAIVANGAEGDNAVLARRLVMALATSHERGAS